MTHRVKLLSKDGRESWQTRTVAPLFDRSGVLIIHMVKLPPGYSEGVQLAITGGEAAITRPGFVEYVAGLLARGVAVRLSAASPATLLNEHLDARLAAQDLPGTRRTLLHLHGLLRESRWHSATGASATSYATSSA